VERDGEQEERWEGIIKAHLCVGQFVIAVIVGPLNRSWDDVLAHICLPTMPAKLLCPGVRRFTLFHLSGGEECARAWNYNGIDRKRGRADEERGGRRGGGDPGSPGSSTGDRSKARRTGSERAGEGRSANFPRFRGAQAASVPRRKGSAPSPRGEGRAKPISDFSTWLTAHKGASDEFCRAF